MHELPTDLKKALFAKSSVSSIWSTITPLAKNEWICWVQSCKLQQTREQRIQRACDALLEGKRRPCCWPGCPHREKTGRKKKVEEEQQSEESCELASSKKTASNKKKTALTKGKAISTKKQTTSSKKK